MLSIKDRGKLLQIVKHCKRIQEKVTSIDKKEFDINDDIREIVCFNIFQIGELAKGLSDELTKKNNKIPWKQIKGMRDIIGHGYETIDVEIVWNTAKDNIKELEEYCEKLLNSQWSYDLLEI